MALISLAKKVAECKIDFRGLPTGDKPAFRLLVEGLISLRFRFLFLDRFDLKTLDKIYRRNPVQMQPVVFPLGLSVDKLVNPWPRHQLPAGNLFFRRQYSPVLLCRSNKKMKIPASTVAQQAVYALHATAFQLQGKGFMKSTMLVECLAQLSPVYFTLAAVGTKGIVSAEVDSEVGGYFRFAQKANINFLSQFNSDIEHPFEAYKKVAKHAVDSLRLIEDYAREVNSQKRIENILDKVIRNSRTPYLSKLDFASLLLRSHALCSKTSPKDRLQFKKILELFESSTTMSEWIESLSSMNRGASGK